MTVNIQTVNDLLDNAKYRESYKAMPVGNTFKDLSTIIIIPSRGVTEKKSCLNCKKCGVKNEYTEFTYNGMSPIFVEAYKNKLIKPMNVPILEMMPQGYEVGEAYNIAIENILANPFLSKFKYILTVEDDNIIPFIPNTQGPLMMLYEGIEKGYDVVGGLYWTKGTPSAPLIYGHPKEKKKSAAGFFRIRYDWKDGELVECNGMGMGFTLFKLSIFKDKKLKKPWFKTCNDHTETGPRLYTQDLFFFEQFKKLGYKCAVDTRVKVGHLDVRSGQIF